MFAGEQRKQKSLFALADATAVLIAFGVALALYDPDRSIEGQLYAANALLLYAGAVTVASIWVLAFRLFDLYRLRSGGLSEIGRIVKGSALAIALTLVLLYLAHLSISRIYIAMGAILSIGFVILARYSIRSLLRWRYTDPRIAIPVIITGFNPLATRLADEIAGELSQYAFLGFVDTTAPRDAAYRNHPVVGGIETISTVAAAYPGLEVIIADPDKPPEYYDRVMRICDVNRVRWRMVPPAFLARGGAFRLDSIGGIPLIGPKSCNIEGLNFILKRTFDIAAAGVVLAMVLPLMLVVSTAIWFLDGRPILFRQTRIGLRGRPFDLLKFRTMRPGSDSIHREYVRKWIGEKGDAALAVNGRQVFKLVDDPRVTGLGRILRHTGIDELPQLIDVLRGEMSLVGPRPALPYEVELYQDWHRRRLDALPGITGLWQVRGRNHLGFDEMVKLDLEYLESWNLMSDLKILIQTVPLVLHRNGY